MEIVVLILIIVLTVISGKKKAGGAKPGGAKPGGAPTLSQARGSKLVARMAAFAGDGEKRPAAASVPAEGADMMDDELCRGGSMAHTHDEGRDMLDDALCRGGSMAHTHDEGRDVPEDEECIGGSMDHTHDEGISRSEQARRMASADSRRAGEDAERGMLSGTEIDATALRRAVVMAEVLGRPRSMRRRA